MSESHRVEQGISISRCRRLERTGTLTRKCVDRETDYKETPRFINRCALEGPEESWSLQGLGRKPHPEGWERKCCRLLIRHSNWHTVSLPALSKCYRGQSGNKFS